MDGFNYKRQFSRLEKEAEFRREKKARTFIGAIDIETDGFGGEYVFGTIHHETWPVAKGYRNMDELMDFLFSLDPHLLRFSTWYSHNAEFDWSRLVKYFERYKDSYDIFGMERMEGKFFRFTIKDKATGKKITTLQDSLALWPHTLAKLAENFAPHCPKGETPLPFDPDNEAHVRYALNDAFCLVEGLKGLDAELYRVYGVHIKATTASTGYQALLRFLPEDEYYKRVAPETEAWFRQCYYGGRVQLNAKTTIYNEKVQSFDINSSYPAQMRKGVPAGKPRFTRIVQDGYPGFYEVDITMPDIPLPFIPHKDENGRLSFPRAGSTFRTFVSSVELEYLVSMGGIYEEVDGFYFPEGLCYPFNNFVDTCEATRNANKGTATETLIKLIQNSVYGKFGTKPEGREIVISYGDEIPDGFVMMFSPEAGELIPHAYVREATKDAAYMLPHWAAWITAQARLELDRGIRMAGAENVLYIDTDSIKTLPAGTVRMLASDLVGKVYGQFKDEGDIELFHVIAPKVYAGYKKGKTGQYEPWFAVKGIPAKQALAQFEALHRGDEIMVEWESPTSFTTMMKTGKMSAQRHRQSTDFRNVYSHVVIDGHWYSRQHNVGS